MQECVVDVRAKSYPDDAIAIMAWEYDKLLGWCLLIPTRNPSACYVSKHAKSVSKYVAQFYVRVSRRGEGIAGTLMDEALRYDRRPHVIPWGPRSAAFFAGYTVSTGRSQRRLINDAKRHKRENVWEI